MRREKRCDDGWSSASASTSWRSTTPLRLRMLDTTGWESRRAPPPRAFTLCLTTPQTDRHLSEEGLLGSNFLCRGVLKYLSPYTLARPVARARGRSTLPRLPRSPPSPSMPAIRQAILYLFARRPFLRCPHCEKLLVAKPEPAKVVLTLPGQAAYASEVTRDFSPAAPEWRQSPIRA